MSTIRAIYDTATGAVTFDAKPGPGWCDFVAAIERHGQTVDIGGVVYGLSVTLDDAPVLEVTLPPPRVVYRTTDQDVLGTARVSPFPSDAECVVTAWVRGNTGEEQMAQVAFTVPRPPQPALSWTWDGAAWAPPVPYPDDGGSYMWDESTGAWAPFGE